jgi:hypothetical protein
LPNILKITAGISTSTDSGLTFACHQSLNSYQTIFIIRSVALLAFA